MVVTQQSIDDRVRCIKAFELILSGENAHYKERLQDPEFVAVVTQAVEAEKAELEAALEISYSEI